MNSSNEQYQITLRSGRVIPIKQSEIHSVELIANPQSQFQQQIQPQYQQPIAHYEPSPAQLRRMRDEQLAQRDLGVSRAIVNISVLLGVLGVFSIVLMTALAIVLNAAKPQPTIVRECNGIFCFSQVDEEVRKA